MRTFGHQRPVGAVTVNPLGGAFGRDKRHRLVVTLAAGDVIAMRPSKTLRTVTGTAADIYRFLLTNAANAALRKQKEYAKTMTRKAARRKARKEFGLS